MALYLEGFLASPTFMQEGLKARSGRQLVSLNQGATGVEPVTYQTVADYSTTELYTRVIHFYAFMYKKSD